MSGRLKADETLLHLVQARCPHWRKGESSSGTLLPIAWSETVASASPVKSSEMPGSAKIHLHFDTTSTHVIKFEERNCKFLSPKAGRLKLGKG